MKLYQKVEATELTFQKYHRQPFQYGTCDCATLASDHLINLGFASRITEAGKWKTERGALRACRRLGHSDLTGVIDEYGFERIAPASATVGDIVGLPGGTDQHEWTALGVCTGEGRVIAFVPDEAGGATCEFGPVGFCTVAWRVAR